MGQEIIDAEEEVQEEEIEEETEEEIEDEEAEEEEQGDEPDPEAEEDHEDGEEVDEEEEPEEQQKKPKKSTNGKKLVPQWQVNKQFRLRREAEEKAARLEKENRELKKQKAQPKTSPRPKIENFETQEEYEDALWDWKEEQKGSPKKEKPNNEDEELAEVLMTFEDRKLELLEEDPNFGKKAYIPQALIPFVANSDALKEMALHWGENQDEALGLLGKTEREVAIEIGRLEARLLSSRKKKKVKPKTDSKAPVSTKPIGSRHTPEVDEERLSDEDWIEKRQKQRGHR